MHTINAITEHKIYASYIGQY